MKRSSKVPAGFKDVLLVDYLAARFTYLPAATWRDWVTNGRLTRNGQRCGVTTRVQPGDMVTCNMPDFDPPSVNLDVGIIYEDDWLLAVNKPPGLRVHSQGKFVTANLIYYLRHQHEPPYPAAQLVNRLDADTSGVVVLAQDKAAARALGTLFSQHEVEKRYIALVQGQPQPASGIIDYPLRKVPGTKVARHEVAKEGAGKTAVTHYQTLETFGSAYALLQLQPVSGRTHQLRVHLAASGHPLVGDGLYQLDDAGFLDWVRNGRSSATIPLLQRQALHCAVTQFPHPVTGANCRLEAPLPSDMAQLIERLQTETTGVEQK